MIGLAARCHRAPQDATGRHRMSRQTPTGCWANPRRHRPPQAATGSHRTPQQTTSSPKPRRHRRHRPPQPPPPQAAASGRQSLGPGRQESSSHRVIESSSHRVQRARRQRRQPEKILIDRVVRLLSNRSSSDREPKKAPNYTL